MICKSYTQAVEVAKIQADRTGQPWRVFRDSTYRWVCEPHEGVWRGTPDLIRGCGRYEIFHAAHQLEFDFNQPAPDQVRGTTGVTKE